MEKELRGNNELIGRILLLIVGVILGAIGTTLMMKAGLGQSTVSALSRNLEFITGVKVGTILSVINYICFGLQIIILRREFKPIQVLQLVLTSIFGALINFFNYDFALTAHINSNVYLIQLSLVFLGIFVMALGVSAMIKSDTILLPFDGFCNAIVYKLNKPFGKIRTIIDGIFVVATIILMVVFKIPNTTVREGTIIFMFSFGRVVGFFNSTIFNSENKFIKGQLKAILSAK